MCKCSLAHIHWQVGGAGWNEALFPPASSVQVAVASPVSSNPESQVYVAVSPTSLPLNDIPPLAGATGSGHFTGAVVRH